MVVVGIVGILAAIAQPVYSGYIARGHRAAARAQLLQAAQYMQRYYSANDQYNIDRTGISVWLVMPPELLRSPPDGTQLYVIDTGESGASMVTTSTFTLAIVPLPEHAMAADKCGGFTITQSGAKGLTGHSPNAALVAECWR